MRTLSAAFTAHLASSTQTLAMCWLTVRRDGTILALTEHDRDITFNLEAAMVARSLTPGPGILGTGSQTYLAASGFSGSDIAAQAGLNVDTGEAQGLLTSPSITEADMLAGLWDGARVAVFQVNWADLTMGALIERVGTLGEVTTDRGFFKAEWVSLTQAYAQNVGRVDSPSCDALLGDARCTIDLTAFTFSGTVASVGDALTFLDAGLTQPGPGGGIAITGITNANPGVVTMASAGTFSNDDPVVLSGIVGPALLNGVTIIRSLSGATWHLGIDTSDTAVYPAYVSGGTVTPLGGTSGYFERGMVTWLTGLNAGLSEQVKSYVPGQVTLQLPMPRAIQVGDTYTIIAGCNKSKATCIAKFNNVINFRGFDLLPGIDQLIQVGRHG